MKATQRLLAFMSLSLWMFVSLGQAETVLDFSSTSARADMGTGDYNLTDLTLEAWIQTTTVPGSGSFGAIAGRGYLAGTTGFGLFIHSDGILRFQTRIGSTIVQPEFDYPFGGTWHHVAGVRDGDDSILYLDGVEVDRVTGVLGSLNNTTYHFGLGQRNTGGTSWGFPFNGRIADVRLWDHARSAQQIASYHASRLEGDEEGLIGYWPLNEGEGSTVFDLTATGKDGTLTSTQWSTDEGLLLDVFRVEDPRTGSARFTGTNAVDIAVLRLLSGYDHLQVREGTQEPLPSAWTNEPPDRLDFDLPAEDGELSWTAWLTNATESVELRSFSASIYYTSTQPTAAVHPTLDAGELVEGVTVKQIFLEDVNDGSTAGVVNGTNLTVHSISIACDADVTPETAHVTLDQAGVYDVILTIVNEAGLSASATSVVTVTSRPPVIHYVAPESVAPDGESWASAFTNLHDAVAAAGAYDIVLVTNGVYTLTNEIVVTEPIVIESVNGRDETTIQRLGENAAPLFRLFTLDHPEAVIDGFTLTGGWLNSDGGGGVQMLAGTLRDCTITGNSLRGGNDGAGVWMSGGLLEHSIISDNDTHSTGDPRGGGIFAAGGIINHCDIVGNKAWGTPNSHGSGAGIFIAGPAQLLNSNVISNDVRQGGNRRNSFGGGIYMNNADGVVSNCVIMANVNHQTRDSDSPHRRGAGIYMTAGLVTHSVIASNQVSRDWQNNGEGHGGGVYMTGGTLRNSLVYRNEAIHASQTTLGAGIMVAGANARVENCTVARNVGGPIGFGDGIRMTAGTIVNTISYFNFDDIEEEFSDHLNLYQTGGTVMFSCMNNTEGLSGNDNITSNPLFVDRFSNDFRLGPGSPAIDQGTDLISAGVVDDIVGTERPQGDGFDMGAYETVEGEGPLLATLVASPEEFDDSGEVEFTASLSGGNLSYVVYSWWFDYDADDPGQPDLSGEDLAVVTNEYTVPGNYTVRLTVEDGDSETVTVIIPALVRVQPLELFVAPGGHHVFPYATWQNAATNIQTAVDAAPSGRTVWVSNGVYQVSEPILLTRGVTLESVNGPEETIIERDPTGGNTRLITMTHENAGVIGFTLRNGFSGSEGGGIWMSAGLVSSSIVTNNEVRGDTNGSGVGGGIWMSGGRVVNSLIGWNQATSPRVQSFGGGIHMTGGIVENCTLVYNKSLPGDNTTDSWGGGIRLNNASAEWLNSIAAFNEAPSGDTSEAHVNNGTASFNHTYPGPAPVGEGNISEDPLFVDAAAGNFRLLPTSSAVDSGTNQLWMAEATDLDGNPRIQRGSASGAALIVDRGAYETLPLQGTLFMIR